MAKFEFEVIAKYYGVLTVEAEELDEAYQNAQERINEQKPQCIEGPYYEINHMEHAKI